MSNISISVNTIKNLQNGDQLAFKVIFDTYYNRQFAFAFQYVKDTYTAEEIVENAILFLWEKRITLTTIKDLKPYLYKIVRNASFDYLKNKNKKKEISIEINLHDSVVDFDYNIIEQETHSILINALEILPEKCKQIFQLCCIDGLKYKEVAEDLEISVNTVKSQRARAIQLLKEHLKESPYMLLFLKFL